MKKKKNINLNPWISYGVDDPIRTYRNNYYKGYKKLFEFMGKNSDFGEDIIKYFNEQAKHFDIDNIDTKQLEEVGRVRGLPQFNYNNKKINGSVVLMGLLKARGNITKAAVDMNVNRSQLENYLDSNEDLIEGVRLIDEMVLDYVEWKLQELIDLGEKNAIQYYLNCRGAERGFGSYEARRRISELQKKRNKGDNGSGEIEII